MNTSKILVIGNSSIDNVLKADNIFHQSISGGNSFHASMAAGIISQHVAILTNIPANYPKRYIDQLHDHGIDISLLSIKKTPVEWEELFVYQENGDRSDGIFINIHTDMDKKELTEDQVRELLDSARTDVYSYQDFRQEYVPDIETIPNDWDIASVHLAPTSLSVHEQVLAMDIPIKTLDPGKYLLELTYEQIKALVSKTTVFAPSKKEMHYIFPQENIIEATIKLGKDCNTHIICKNGKDGCYVYDNTEGNCYVVGTYPENEIQNLTGAGDSFCGALNASLTEGYSLIDAARMATVVSAKAIETISATDRNKINFEFVKKEFTNVLFRKVMSNA